MILLFYKHEARPEKVLRRAQVHTRLRLTSVFFCLLELFRHLYPALKNASPFFSTLVASSLIILHHGVKRGRSSGTGGRGAGSRR